MPYQRRHHGYAWPGQNPYGIPPYAVPPIALTRVSDSDVKAALSRVGDPKVAPGSHTAALITHALRAPVVYHEAGYYRLV